MCGRFTLIADPNQLREIFPWVNIPFQLKPRYNIAPSQPAAVIPNDGTNNLDFFIFGLIPSWTKDTNKIYKMINARAETIDQKPSFRNAFKRRRCLIPVSGFFEWQKQEKASRKQPYYIRMKNNKPFAIAGIWEEWNAPDGSIVKSFAIITTQPNKLLRDIHNRMPVILPPDKWEQWMDTAEISPQVLKPLLKPYPSDQMLTYSVSTSVNRPENDHPECIQPIKSNGDSPLRSKQAN